jgi:hypothetical protein
MQTSTCITGHRVTIVVFLSFAASLQYLLLPTLSHTMLLTLSHGASLTQAPYDTQPPATTATQSPIAALLSTSPGGIMLADAPTVSHAFMSLLPVPVPRILSDGAASTQAPPDSQTLALPSTQAPFIRQLSSPSYLQSLSAVLHISPSTIGGYVHLKPVFPQDANPTHIFFESVSPPLRLWWLKLRFKTELKRTLSLFSHDDVVFIMLAWHTPFDAFERRLFDSLRCEVIILANAQDELDGANASGIRAVWAHHNLLIDDSLFTFDAAVSEAARTHALVVNSRFEPWKRVELAASVATALFIGWSGTPPPAILDRVLGYNGTEKSKILSKMVRGLAMVQAVVGTHSILGSCWTNLQELVRVLHTAQLGGVFSATEGGNRATSEKLVELCVSDRCFSS